ncbi:hypothetical protein M0R45_035883 [Rubus argutus]|uniref:Uncharacterized protein n=1 Tax=Rubus argutus TaxID=59490 RepID=A0AAW1VUE8_RUBAR
MKEAPGWSRRWTSVAATYEARRGLGLLPASTTERGREQISGGLVGLSSSALELIDSEETGDGESRMSTAGRRGLGYLVNRSCADL